MTTKGNRNSERAREIARGTESVANGENAMIRKLIEQCPQVLAMLPKSQYLGVCAVQAPGAWLRMGPTWLYHSTSGPLYICAGPGVEYWGTTQGLAELATQDTAKPSWHAVGVSLSPANIVFACTPASIEAYGLARYASEADELNKEVK